MDTEHTPLPWTLDKYGSLVGADRTKVVISGVGVALSTGIPEPVAISNGVLFLHSVNLLPELVEALREARPYVDLQTFTEARATLATIDVLLAKATS